MDPNESETFSNYTQPPNATSLSGAAKSVSTLRLIQLILLIHLVDSSALARLANGVVH